MAPSGAGHLAACPESDGGEVRAAKATVYLVVTTENISEIVVTLFAVYCISGFLLAHTHTIVTASLTVATDG